MMRAAAILGPGAKESDLAPFRGPEIQFTDELKQADAVLVLGGDGTVHRHLHALVEAQRPVLVVPHGSGNDFARALGISSPRQALAVWSSFQENKARVRRVDLGLIRSADDKLTYFCCAGGAGIDADAARRASLLPAWLRGSGGYALSLAWSLLSFAPAEMTVSSEEESGALVERVSELGYLVAFANAPAYGHGMRIAPHADMEDGRLDICFVRGTSKVRLMRLFPRVYWGNHLHLREIEYFQTERVRIESKIPLEVHADGEFVSRTPIEVSIARRALPVIR